MPTSSSCASDLRCCCRRQVSAAAVARCISLWPPGITPHRSTPAAPPPPMLRRWSPPSTSPHHLHHHHASFYRVQKSCKPLHYPVLMNQGLCTKLVISSASMGFLFSTIETIIIFTLPFCGPNKIHHFFCDMAPLLELACGRNYIGEDVIFLICFLVVFCCFFLILLSYLLIINTTLKIPTTDGKRKAFSTCASHLIVVVVHFGCISIIYLRPQSRNTLNDDTLISVTYTLVTPLLNPVVYSLRNKDVQVALKKSLGRSTSARKM
ncbi:PREDICTED: olfactory receptor 10R2-like [Gekko japonicus]|uniref:Olfactory receptor 10R2-like n=1 Tax=Gekko japonicus TaxID=146911 RepID=A0ABM1JL05_GEKJA|nr:PREDICTED: olfactory receptor 10R2-like [Gekko japonicus]